MYKFKTGWAVLYDDTQAYGIFITKNYSKKLNIYWKFKGKYKTYYGILFDK